MPYFTLNQLMLGGLFVVLSALITTLVVGIFVVSIPADYFVSEKRQSLVHVRSRAARIGLRIAKNLLGLLLVCVGVILALPGVPGQGILTILIGILFLDVPGKHKLERRLVRRRGIRRVINRVRKRYGKEPLVIVSEP